MLNKEMCHPCNEQRYGDSDLNVCVVIIKKYHFHVVV